MLKFSLSRRWASVAMVSNTMDDLPEPDTPVKMVILRLGMRRETFFRLFSRAPRSSMYSWGIFSPRNDGWICLFLIHQSDPLLYKVFKGSFFRFYIFHILEIYHAPVGVIALQQSAFIVQNRAVMEDQV